MFPRGSAGLKIDVDDIFEWVKAQWASRSEVAIVKSKSPSDIDLSATFDVGVCMETLEHLPDKHVDGYLQLLARIVRGPVFFTIPVERGAMLVAKQLGYRALGMYGDRLSWRDLLAGALSQTDKIPRHEHTGFDDRLMIERIARYFDVTESGGLFVPYFTTLNFTLGIVGTAHPVDNRPTHLHH